MAVCGGGGGLSSFAARVYGDIVVEYHSFDDVLYVV